MNLHLNCKVRTGSILSVFYHSLNHSLNLNLWGLNLAFPIPPLVLLHEARLSLVLPGSSYFQKLRGSKSEKVGLRIDLISKSITLKLYVDRYLLMKTGSRINNFWLNMAREENLCCFDSLVLRRNIQGTYDFYLISLLGDQVAWVWKWLWKKAYIHFFLCSLSKRLTKSPNSSYF